ncbi:MAG: twitching motility protein [candidate division WS6 bacterium 34_10]|uniref:Twitching motility protein n=1 Tax=candidate division WS6 bacterium 34_10 TaxID=1641389 RepID=A0A101HH99_9BACT|nr:MAG: twitching motility protein [candidate division WS6 bacterium 34_10]
MDNTAQNNGIDLTVPTLNNGSTQQANGSQQQDLNNSLSGTVPTPDGVVEDDLSDIMPDPKLPRAMQRTPKEKNLATPLPGIPEEREKAKPQSAEPEVETNQKKTAPELEINKLGDDEVIKQVMMDENQTSSPEPEGISYLFEYTIEKGASDLHLTVGYPPIIRIDGELQKVNDDIIDPAKAEELILPLLSDDKRELLEVNKEIDFAYTHEGKYIGRFRINAFYSMKTLSASFRLIPSRVRTIEELKLPPIYHQFAQLKQGMVLVTGPTGHGKSTTIAAMLEDINRSRFERVVTIEDPIEYIFDGKKSLFDQREMGQDTHSWTIALKSAMRQDPDIILVGEMRDYETIASAITLAETGHLVFATLHTNSTAQSIDRMIDVFPEEQQSQIRAQLSNILEVVIAQRLIPLEQGGRRAVAEILVVNPAVQTLIRESKSHQIDNVIRTSSDIGMISLERSLVQLVREGVISVSKAQEYAVYPEEVTRLLKS